MPQLVDRNADVAAVYVDGSYLARNPTWHEEDSPWKATQIRTILDRNNVKPSTMCEVGCGAGEIARLLATDYGQDVLVSGYEISPQAFQICKKKEQPNLRFFLSNLLDESDASFDVVLSIDVFEHVEDYLGFLRKLRPRGRYTVFHIPLDLSVQTVLRVSPIRKVREKLGHLHYFTKETALAALKDTGYEVIDCSYTNISLDLSKYGWKNRLMRLPRRLLFAIRPDLAARILGRYSLLVLAK